MVLSNRKERERERERERIIIIAAVHVPSSYERERTGTLPLKGIHCT